jgi:phosphonopyruvate decarboxylase
LFPTEVDAIGPALDRAVAHMDATGRPYALVMRKGSVAPFALGAVPAPADRARSAAAIVLRGDALATRRDALVRVIANTPADASVVFASTGFCGRELYALDDRPNQLYFVGSMGCVTMLALGFALARPDLDVVAIDGDGAALMRMGAFATLGAYGPPNLAHLLLDNGAHESTGGQATVSRGVAFADVATACGYASALDSDDPAAIPPFLLATPASAGPRFLRLRIAQGTPSDLPRPTIAPEDVARRLRAHIQEGTP